ncbi:MAG: hypothetical protein H0U74_03575 [Bradymonadaceae bacterium]|nr:hypothetical protein [Lujinxingiaceae bacterium]
MGKIKLSDTLKFITDKLNRVAGSNFELELILAQESVMAGRPIRGQARLRCPNDKKRTLDFMTISVSGQVQQDGRWVEYTQSAQIAHDTELPIDKEFVVPILINVPLDAVLSEDGAVWRLRVQADIDRTIDPRAEVHFQVLSTGTGQLKREQPEEV